ncbi:MAG: oxidoreductase [Gammaproteobacteria bacterium]|nr:oxidoreductase [Gammaproteobacteria bacterium]
MVVRVGVVGTGNIGSQHILLLQSGKIKGAQLAATASRSASSLQTDVPHFKDYREMFSHADINAVLIATPTMSHVEIAQAAIQCGLPIMMEKPLAMSVGQAEKLLALVPDHLQFAIMLSQRFDPAYARLKQLLMNNAIGNLQRIGWTMTKWYRPDIYYKVSRWRGTWPGEGGGLLINQCIHNLDVLQWLVGLPDSITAKVGFGKHHDIDVEDEVSAIMTFDNGAIGTLTASSGEAPGVNRLEIVGDRGSLILEHGVIDVLRADENVRTHCRTTHEMFGMPVFDREVIEITEESNQHAAVLQNFVDSLEIGSELLTPTEQGLGSLQLANGILLSAWNNETVTVPIDTNQYEARLQEKIHNASLRAPKDLQVETDMKKSYQ